MKGVLRMNTASSDRNTFNALRATGWKRAKTGSALAAVLILCTAAAMIGASTMNVSTNDRKMNRLAALNTEARNASEAVVEYGLAELSQRFEGQNTFLTNELARSKRPLTLPSSFYSVFSGSNLVLPANPYNGTVAHGTYSTELIGGTVPDAGWMFLDPRIPGNASDTLCSRNVLVRQIKIFGKATVSDSAGNTVVSRCSATLQVRDAPLFSYAVFYNMDMEVAPGVSMKIVGPAHTNKNLYVCGQSGASLSFYDTVTAVGRIYHTLKTGYGESVGSGIISFTDDDGNLVAMNTGSAAGFDSTYADWYNKSMSLWDGNVQDASYGVQKCASVSLPDYQSDDTTTSTKDDALNYAYQMIMPLNTTASAVAAVEEQKYAYKAGLVIVVSKDSSGVSTWSLYAQKHDAKGNLIYSGTAPDRTLLCSSTSTDPEIAANLSAIFAKNNYVSSTSGGVTTVSGGLYDTRRQSGIDIFEINMGKFRDAIQKNDARDWGNTTSATDATYAPSTWWNGVVYVEFPTTATTAGADGVKASDDGFGLRLKNAQSSGSGSSYVAGIPAPSWSTATGTTLATNNVMYVQGSYNADGKSSTGSSTVVDDANEPAASLVADAITLLSAGWLDSESARQVSKTSTTYKYAGAAADYLEISAALITGIVPTNKALNGYGSGSVNNLPRFLEMWGTTAQTVRYRGSLVALYESEIAIQPFRTSITSSNYVFSPPNRDWGFNSLFSDGVYPPGTPNMRSFKRVDLQFLNEAEWNAQTASLP